MRDIKTGCHKAGFLIDYVAMIEVDKYVVAKFKTFNDQTSKKTFMQTYIDYKI